MGVQEGVMMSVEAFEAAIREARKMEKKILEYTPFDGDINIERSVEIEPEEYVDLSYNDLYKMYERTQKIKSARDMGILTEKPEEGAEVSAASQEVESKLKEMTTETLKEAAELAKEPSVEEAKAPVAPAEAIELEREAAPPQEIEFEALEKPPEQEIEFEKEVEIPFKKEAPPEEKPAVRPPPALEVPEEEKPAVKLPPALEVPMEKPAAPPTAVPPTLRETPDEAAARRYRQIEEQITSTLGEGADELTLKKKMLELTKGLFKEKITSKREEIKLKIKVLKNMLTAMREGGKKMKATSETQFDAIMAEQQEELAHTKGKTIDSYMKQIGDIKDKFYAQMGELEEPEERKKTYEAFVSSVTMLVEKVPASVKERKDFVSQKHSAELSKLKESLTAKDKTLMKKVDERLAYVEESYDDEFSMVKHIVGREIENLIEVAGSEIFRKPEEKRKGKKPEPTEIVKEINETDEGTLLYFLHSKEPEHYKKYERKHISRAEAIFKAKELLAKEKGLSDSMISKYFSFKED
jgi:hypothetical protein